MRTKTLSRPNDAFDNCQLTKNSTSNECPESESLAIYKLIEYTRLSNTRHCNVLFPQFARCKLCDIETKSIQLSLLEQFLCPSPLTNVNAVVNTKLIVLIKCHLSVYQRHWTCHGHRAITIIMRDESWELRDCHLYSFVSVIHFLHKNMLFNI